MQLRPNEEELPELLKSARELKKANADAGDAEKAQEAAKVAINKWLIEKRGIDVNAIAVGEVVLIEGVLLFKMGEMKKFAELDFKTAHPDLHASFVRKRPVKRYDPLV